MNNALIAYEVLYSFKQKQDGARGDFALKLDMSKAYDRVEWSFIKKVTPRMGFYDKWVSLVMGCVRTVKYLVLFNRVH